MAFNLINLMNEWLFLLLTFLQLYILAAIYVLKEFNRKLQLFGSVRHLSFDDDDLPKRLDGQLAVITGGSRGIGLEAAKVLIKKGCHVIIASSARKEVTDKIIEQVEREIDTEFSKNSTRQKRGKLEIWHLDLTSMNSVVKFHEMFLGSGYNKLNFLINNAAIMFGPKKITQDGFESHFQVNYLCHCLLIFLMLPIMIKTAKLTGIRSRIVNVSSSTHFARNLQLDDLQSIGKYSPFHSYAASKLAQIMFTYQFTKWLRRNQLDQFVTCNSLHPGVAKTELYENVWWFKIAPFIAHILMRVIKLIII